MFRLIESRMRNNISIGPVLIKSSVKKEIIVRTNEIPVMIDNIFDVGHGGGSFAFSQAIPAINQGLKPNTISTDLHTGSMNGGMKDLLNVMSKFLNMGLNLNEVITSVTWDAAKSIKKENLGNLSVGSIADITILNLREGDFGFIDTKNKKMNGTKKLECELTIKDGKIVYDLNGLASLKWDE